MAACACYRNGKGQEITVACSRLTVDEKAGIERGAQLDGGKAVNKRRSLAIRGRRKPFYAVNSNVSESGNN